MVARLIGTLRPVTVEAHRALMTALARHRTGVRLRPVVFPEFKGMARRGLASQYRARRASLTARGERCDHARCRSNVANSATLLRVAGGACGAPALGLPTVRTKEIGCQVAWRNR